MRGSSALPALTPSRPPQPSSMSCCRSNTSTSNPNRAPSATATSAMSAAVRWPGGVFARSRAMFAARAVTMPVSMPADAARRSTPSSEQLDALEGRVLRLPLQLAEPVAGEDGALGQRLGRVRGIRRADRRHAQPDAAEAARSRGRRRRPRRAGGRCRARRTAPAPTTTMSGRRRRAQRERRAGLRLEPGERERLAVELEAGGQVAVARDEHADGVEALLVELLRQRHRGHGVERRGRPLKSSGISLPGLRVMRAPPSRRRGR